MRKIYTLLLVFSCMPFFMASTAAPTLIVDKDLSVNTIHSDYQLNDMDALGAIQILNDTIAPVVTNITPEFVVNQPANSMTVSFTLTYNEPVKLGESHKFAIHANPGPNQQEVEVIAGTGLAVQGNTIKITPTTVFTLTGRYELIITAGSVTDSAGNWANSYTHVFIYDQTAPQLVSVAPNLNELQPLDVSFIITYNENVQLYTSYQIMLYHYPPGQERVLFEQFNDTTITVEENVITINPSRELNPLSTYELVITSGSVRDMAGNAAGSYTRSFSTVDNIMPVLVQKSPAFSTNGKLSLLFSKDVTPHGAQATIGRQSNNEVVATLPLQQDGNRQLSLTLDISQFTDDNEKFVVEIDSALIRDNAGNLWTGLGSEAWVVGLPDRTKPELLTIEPNLDNPVPRNAIFTFTFSENIKLANSYNIELRFYEDDGGPYNNNKWVNFEYFDESSITIIGNKMILDPKQLFEVTQNVNRAEYQLIISGGSITDMANNSFVWGDRSNYSKIFNTSAEMASFVTFNPMHGDTLEFFPDTLTITFGHHILLSDSTEVTQAALDTLVYLNKGGQAVAYHVSITDSRIIKIALGAEEIPENGAQYTFGFRESFKDTTGNQYTAEEATFTLRDNTVTIAEVRGEVAVSPMDGETVRITGTVTAIFPGEGFFVQDANAARSGIWVAWAETDTLQTGGGVVVVGEVDNLNQVTSIVADKIWRTSAPLTVEPIVVDFTVGSIARYESVLVQVTEGRASSVNELGTWILYFDETTDSVVVGNRVYVYAPVAENLYNVTGVVSFRGGVYRIQPRMEADVVDASEVTSVPVPSGMEFNIYPNPFGNYVKISNHEKLSRVVISNITGQLVVDIKYPGAEINTSRLINGVYIISLFDDKGLVKTNRIIKR